MRSVKASMTRPKLSGDCPDNTCTLHEALHAYTAGGAYAGFDEDRLGMLKTGMLADIVVMDCNLETLSIDVIDQAKARTTIVDGKIVWGV
jgi:predicted amidohydrolase YtcJ